MNKPRYTNDRKAPRMKKAQYSKKVIDKSMWKEFREKFPEYASLSDSELNTKWNELAAIIRTELVTNPLGVKLGSYTGELKLQYLPYKMEGAIDPAASDEAGELVKHLNVLTRGKVARVKWERRWAVKFNKMLQFFSFEAERPIMELAKKHIDENPEKLRVSRNTLGGQSFWRNIKNQHGK